MRPLSILVVLVLAGAAVVRPAEGRRRRASPAVRPTGEAEIRRGLRGDELWVSGRRFWPTEGQGGTVAAGPVWSRRGDAVALVARGRHGTTLVVAIVDGDAAPTTLTFPLPPRARTARAVMWLGPRRVAVGSRPLEPQVVASWDASAP